VSENALVTDHSTPLSYNKGTYHNQPMPMHANDLPIISNIKIPSKGERLSCRLLKKLLYS